MTKNKRLFIGLGAAAVMIGGYFATVVFLGADVGEPCDKEWGCKGMSAVCLEGEAPLCSRHCEANDECLSGWTCDPVTVWTLDGKSADPKVSSTPVCLPPRAP